MDNIIRRKDKKAWGFTADANGVIQLGKVNDVDPDDIRSTGAELSADGEAARGNGGGFPAEDAVTLEYLQTLTKPKLLELAKEHDITLDKPKGSKDEILAELVEYYGVEPKEEETTEE